MNKIHLCYARQKVFPSCEATAAYTADISFYLQHSKDFINEIKCIQTTQHLGKIIKNDPIKWPNKMNPAFGLKK